MSIAARTVASASPSYDAIVVGSGYGGGVAASRLARMGYRVAVLEQGRLWRPGDFPTTIKARRKTTRFTGRASFGDPAGLYYLSVGKGLTVFGASGLGGGSLINAGVVLRPNFDRLQKLGWPSEVTGDGHFAAGLGRAEAMLGVAPAPCPERFAKYHGMRHLAEAGGAQARTPAMTIAHEPGVNVSGVMQYGCRYCGDCWSGCNVGAKNTIGITYITDAVDHGAEVFCQSPVRSIAKTASGWAVVADDLTQAKSSRRIEAPILVLAAGTMGTVELMMRAARQGLPLSQRLGDKFSANGDDLVIAAQLEKPVHAIATGFPPQAPPGSPVVGPHSMALIDLGDEEGPLWVHDGTMLIMMAKMGVLNDLVTFNFKSALQLFREGIWGQEMSRSQLLYIVASDDASGKLRLEKDRAVVDWPGYSTAPTRVRAEARVKAMIEAAGGTFFSNPFALSAFGGNRIIAHPLGGCGMGADATRGVVAHDGRVFDPTQGPQGVHEGLYVCDGAAIPSAIGVSPLLTITALAERAMALAAQRLQRPLDLDRVPARPVRDAAM